MFWTLVKAAQDNRRFKKTILISEFITFSYDIGHMAFNDIKTYQFGIIRQVRNHVKSFFSKANCLCGFTGNYTGIFLILL